MSVPEPEVDIEAREYARRFEEEDQKRGWRAGSTDARLAPVAVLVLEAFRLMNAGPGPQAGLVPSILRRAAEEYERVRRDGLRSRG